MPQQHRAESYEIATGAFHFGTTFHCGTLTSWGRRSARIWFSVNPAFRLGTGAHGPRAIVFNEFTEFVSGTSSALPQCESNDTTKEDEDMKRSSALTIFLGTVLLAGTASAAVAPSENIQAPRAQGEDIQAPHASTEDIQAPRTSSEDVQAPRTGSQDIQAPRTGSQDIQAPRG
jgi:hypothetical protein